MANVGRAKDGKSLDDIRRLSKEVLEKTYVNTLWSYYKLLVPVTADRNLKWKPKKDDLVNEIYSAITIPSDNKDVIRPIYDDDDDKEKDGISVYDISRLSRNALEETIFGTLWSYYKLLVPVTAHRNLKWKPKKCDLVDEIYTICDAWIRNGWKVGSKMNVYSESAHKWFVGEVKAMSNDAEGEWLDVQYECGQQMRSKQIHRDDRGAIRPFSDAQIRNSWVPGSKVEVFSRGRKQWMTGFVTKVFVEDQGEWLKVNYGKSMTKEMLRMSHDIRPLHVAYKNMSKLNKNGENKLNVQRELNAKIHVKIKKRKQKKDDGKWQKPADVRTFIRNVKETKQLTLSKSKKVNGVIRDIYKYDSSSSSNLKITRNKGNPKTRRIDIHRPFGSTQCDIKLSQDTLSTLKQYFLIWHNYNIISNWWRRYIASSIEIQEEIKGCISLYIGSICPPPIFIPTMQSRLNKIDLTKHYGNYKYMVFLVIHKEEYNHFYDKYKAQSNFFFVTHTELCIPLIRQCIKFIITSDLFHNQFGIGFYYECDDDVEKLAYAQQTGQNGCDDDDDDMKQEWILETYALQFNRCLELLHQYIQLMEDHAIILSTSPLRRFSKYYPYKKTRFGGTTRCEKLKIVRICDEFKNVNYASEDMLKMSYNEWLKMKKKRKNGDLEDIQKKYFQGEDFGLCEQLAISKQVIPYKGKHYEAYFTTKCFIFECIGIVSEYNVESGCKTIK